MTVKGWSPMTRTSRPKALWALVVLLGLLAAGGTEGGLSFVVDPTGASLGAKLSWLEHTPVSDFLLPGLFLLVVYGVGGLVLMAGLIRRSSPGPLHRVDQALGHHWAWAGAIALGMLLVIWIAYELAVIPETTFLQPALIVIGLFIAGLPLLPSLRRWFATGD
jgi:hypothetical protein